MTYRQLLDAIEEAHRLKALAIAAANNDKRLWGTPDEQDRANNEYRFADRALDQEILT